LGRAYSADPAVSYQIVDLSGLTAIFHRKSGVTHVVSDPVPQILGVLHDKSMNFDGIFARLSTDFDLDDDQETRIGLQARLDEMSEVGLVASA
jgi:PqqD family protein of HPr-rel-A system